MAKPRLYTVGHSNHEIEYFIALLKAWSVDCIVDVRSVPASRFNPQYNKKALEASLKEKGITYLHMPDEFGARQASQEVLTEGKVDFQKVRKSRNFREGVERLKKGVKKGFTISLMCAEAEPLQCHRFSMITPGLKKEGFEILHILKDKSLATNAALEEQLLNKYKKKFLTSSLFPVATSFEERLIAAYDLLSKEIAYVADQS